MSIQNRLIAGGRRSRFVCPRRFFSSSRRSRAAFEGAVGTRRRSTRSASRSWATSRSTASSRFRSWLRSSCAAARSTGPAFATTRRFCDRRQRARRLDVEDGDDARLRLLRVLAARPARTGRLELDLGGGERDRAGDANRLALHGRDSARRGRCPARLGRADPRGGRGGSAAESRRTPASLRHQHHHPLARPARRGHARLRHRARGRRGADDRGRSRPGSAREARPRARHAQHRRRPRRDRPRRGRSRRGAPRRRGRDAGDEPRLLVHEPRARVRRARGGRGALLPPPQPLVADEARPAAGRRHVRRRARVRGRRGRASARQAEPGVLRGRVRGARRRAEDDVDGRRRSGDRRRRRTGRRPAYGPRPNGEVPAGRRRGLVESSRTGSSPRSATSRNGSRRTCDPGRAPT